MTKRWNAVVERATIHHVSCSIAPSYHWGVSTDDDLPSDLTKGDTIELLTDDDGLETLGFTYNGVFYKKAFGHQS